MRRRAVPLLLFFLPACTPAPVPPPKPYTAELLSYQGGKYLLADEKLETLDELSGMKGAVASFQGGGTVSFATGLGSDEGAWRRAYTPTDGSPVRLAYENDNGVVRALDYSSFAMLGIYRELERIRDFYRGLGVADPALKPIPVWYHASISLFSVPFVQNNAAYSPEADGLLLFSEYLDGDEVPLDLNLGVMAHEYGHAVFNHLAWGGHVPRSLLDGWPSRGTNMLRALEEGLADLLGATITDDPRFLSRSSASAGAARDLSVKQVADLPMWSAASASSDSYDPYPLGTVLAAALWRVGDDAGRTAVAKTVVKAELGLAGKMDSKMELTAGLQALIEAADGPGGGCPNGDFCQDASGCCSDSPLCVANTCVSERDLFCRVFAERFPAAGSFDRCH